MSDQSLNLASLFDALRRYEAMRDRNPSDPSFRNWAIEDARNNPPVANYINNPWRSIPVQGGITLRSLMGLDPTDQQRLEDAFASFPARQYGKFPGK